MKVLKAIGDFFVRIWRWIKETAWVQPLLIVGAIFAIIFSIPYFTKWIGSFGWGSSNSYYQTFQVSLEGEVAGKQGVSNVDKLTTKIWEDSDLSKSDDDFKNNPYDAANYDTAAYGEKFFVVYVSSNCSSCETIQPGFATLQEGWGTSFSNSDGRAFKMYTIYSDETSSNDDQDANKYTAFQRYLNNYQEFYELAGSRLAEQTPYRYNANLDSSTDYTYFQNADITNFKTPTILLVDYSKEAYEVYRTGVSEVLFGVNGTSKYDKASLLLQMWNHTDADSKNPFSKSYSK